MAFTSQLFFIFFPAVCLLYFVLPKLWMKNALLLVASYGFYAGWGIKYAFLLLGMTLFSYLIGLWFSRITNRSGKKAVLIIALILLIGIMIFGVPTVWGIHLITMS